MVVHMNYDLLLLLNFEDNADKDDDDDDQGKIKDSHALSSSISLRGSLIINHSQSIYALRFNIHPLWSEFKTFLCWSFNIYSLGVLLIMMVMTVMIIMMTTIELVSVWSIKSRMHFLRPCWGVKLIQTFC